MRFSLMTEPQLSGTYDDILAAARFTEEAGLVSFARSDHLYWEGDPQPATDAFATLAGLARDTNTIRLCVLVTPITFRHPAVIAKNAATIDQMSGGRLDLGVGTGWNDFEHDALGLPFPDDEERWQRFEDALGYLEAAFAPGHGSHDGPFYHLDAQVDPKPTGVRMVVGGSGAQRTPRLAGERADEYNLLMTTPERTAARVAVMREAAGGRAVEVTMMGRALVARDDAGYRSLLEKQATRRGRSETEVEAELAAHGTLHGTPTMLAEQLAALEEAGVERIYLQWLDLPNRDGMYAMVEAVLLA
jgi:alkanesulfonate monooxygenase SsuD/methylene tetrahydromethanopterin reductase-like flavin-dependent oxidoreductase (luciferase family)